MKLTTRILQTSCLVGVAGFCFLASINSRTLAQQPAAQNRLVREDGAGDYRDVDSNEPGDFPNVFRNIAARSRNSIVSIEAWGPAVGRACRGFGPYHARGLGFVTDSGVVLTNSHFLSRADRVVIRSRAGDVINASRVDLDPLSDLAVVRIDPRLDVTPLRMGDSSLVGPGDWVMALGNGPSNGFVGPPTVATGVVGSIGPGPGIAGHQDLFHVGTVVGSGNSGGPLLNLNGEVVGMGTTLTNEEEWAGAQPGYAVPGNQLRWVSQQLIDHGSVRRGFIGLRTQPMNKHTAADLKSPEVTGARVTEVQAGSPAAKAELRVNDVIVKLDNQQIIHPRQLQSIAEHLEVGKSYPIEVLRNGASVKSSVVPAAMVLPAKYAPRSLRLASPANSVSAIGAGKYTGDQTTGG